MVGDAWFVPAANLTILWSPLSTEEASHSEVRAPASVEAPRAGEDDRPDKRVHHDASAAVRSPAGALPLVEGVAVLEPASCEDGSAHEVGQPATRLRYPPVAT